MTIKMAATPIVLHRALHSGQKEITLEYPTHPNPNPYPNPNPNPNPNHY